MALKREVAERITELRAERALSEDVNAQAVIATLLRIAKAGEDLATPAGVKEARLTVLEAWRLGEALNEQRERERRRLTSVSLEMLESRLR